MMSAGAPDERDSCGQLPLELPTAPRFGRDEFLPAASNRAALEMIDRWPDWPDRVLMLIGPPGAGKSHLCAIWAARAGALVAAPEAPPALEALLTQAPRAVLIDNIDRVADETALFHLLNFVNETRRLSADERRARAEGRGGAASRPSVASAPRPGRRNRRAG